VLRKGEVKSFFQVGHCFLSVGDEDTPCGKILAEEAEPFDGSFDFPLVYVSTSTVNSIIVESLDGLRRETFLLDGTLYTTKANQLLPRTVKTDALGSWRNRYR
jgi:hypothetical protein